MSDNDVPDAEANRVIDRLIREAKQDLLPRVTDTAWEAMEGRLVARMARTETEDQASDLLQRAAAERRRRFRWGAAALAMAAGIALLVSRESGREQRSSGDAQRAELSAGSLRTTEGSGTVRIQGVAVESGHVLRAGDDIEVDSARAILERSGKVRWLLEREAEAPGAVARAHVKSAGESLIVGLDKGVVEAQVTPVPSGEAFAVDIATSSTLVRVAVHGTHFRVARSGTHVVVDLTEGVVSIGVPPPTGVTNGTIVTAPSHVEFDAASLESTLRIDRSPGSVRTAVSLAMERDVPTAPPPGSATSVASATPTGARSPVPNRAQTRSPAESVGSVPNGDPGLPPREAISQAVRECALAQRRSGTVRVTVTTSLQLKVAPNGEVESARFDPPLLPAVQTCAAAAIYKVKMLESKASALTIPIEFTY